MLIVAPYFFIYMKEQELLDSVLKSEKSKQSWRNKFGSVEWANANRLNKILTGIGLNQSKGCECLEDLFFLAKRPNVISKIKIQMSKQFILEKGKLIQSFNHGDISNHSTDEEVINALKQQPKIIKYFKSYPENWEDLVFGGKPQTEESPKEEVEELEVEELGQSDEEVKEDSAEGLNEDVEPPLELETLTVAQIKGELNKRNIPFKNGMKKAQLLELF